MFFIKKININNFNINNIKNKTIAWFILCRCLDEEEDFEDEN